MRESNKDWVWPLWAAVLLLFILLPFLGFQRPLTAWADGYLSGGHRGWVSGIVLGGLLAADVALPVPSSLVSTGCGLLLGMWMGTLVSWAGMTVGCMAGYWVGRGAGSTLVRRLAGEAELMRVAKGAERFGDWIVVLFRAVPVLAEASVIFAGTIRMAPRRFLFLAALSNLGISLAYAAVGAYAAGTGSFLLAFGGGLAAPGLAILSARFLEKGVWRR